MQNNFKAKAFLKAVIASVFWIAVWEIISIVVSSEVIFPSPLTTFAHLIKLAGASAFWKCVLNSIFHIISGFLIAVISAVVLSAVTYRSQILFTIFSPLLKIVKATPVASFIVLALIWLKSGVATFISMLMVLPLIFSNLTEGYKSTDKKLLEFAKIYRFSFFKKAKYIYIPTLMPYFISACSVGLGFAWKAGIAAEVIGLPKDSLGYEIYNAKISLETPDLFAVTAIIIILSFIIEKGFMLLLSNLSKKITGGTDNDKA